MNFRLAFLSALPLAVLAFAACGDGPDEAAETPSAGSPTATVPADALQAKFGPAPEFGENVVKLSPGYAESVKQLATQTKNPQRPNGICAEVSFAGLPETGRWFRMAVDGVEVTAKLVWIVSSNTTPTGGTMCYAPTEGIAVGVHQAAISVQDPNNITARTRELVAWAFEVTE
ncbi:MAG: hypothetical protein IPI85_09205 [Dehalococcoidia bacterium]|nr:hypothetical protein [Dehalococcoidia bacterium]